MPITCGISTYWLLFHLLIYHFQTLAYSEFYSSQCQNSHPHVPESSSSLVIGKQWDFLRPYMVPNTYIILGIKLSPLLYTSLYPILIVQKYVSISLPQLLQVKKLRHIELKWPSLGHTLANVNSQISNLDKPLIGVLNTILCYLPIRHLKLSCDTLMTSKMRNKPNEFTHLFMKHLPMYHVNYVSQNKLYIYQVRSEVLHGFSRQSLKKYMAHFSRNSNFLRGED